MPEEIFIKIHGDVIGVNFRHHTREQAIKLNLTGWVRNAPDGTVEILAQGEKADLEKLLDWTKTGPRLAVVANIETAWRPVSEPFHEFEIRY